MALRANPRFRDIGKRFGGRTQQAAGLIRGLDTDALRTVRGGGEAWIELDGDRHAVTTADLEIIEEAAGDRIVETDSGCTIALDATLDDDLRREGLARELVNRIQRLRRESGFEVSDRIRVTIGGAPPVIDAVGAHRDYIAGETLAVDIEVRSTPDETTDALDVDGHPATIILAHA